jgi:uncharacterized cupin superfamily protein
MPSPTLPAFDPADLAESNATSYPEKFRADNSRRWNRRLGDHAGLTNFGVNLTRIVPGAQSSARHAHSRQDEFIWVVSGEIVLETNEGAQTLRTGMCAGFPAGCGNAHRFVNRSAEDAMLLVVGDRTPFDEITYRGQGQRFTAPAALPRAPSSSFCLSSSPSAGSVDTTMFTSIAPHRTANVE